MGEEDIFILLFVVHIDFEKVHAVRQLTFEVTEDLLGVAWGYYRRLQSELLLFSAVREDVIVCFFFECYYWEI